MEKSATLRLSRIEKIITQYVESCKILDKPVIEQELRSHLDRELGKKQVTKSFFDDMDKMMTDMESGVMLKKDGGRYSHHTIKGIKSLKSSLIRYEDASKYRFTYDMSKSDYDNLIAWLTKKDYSRNTIADLVGYLSMFFSRMKDAGRHSNTIYEQFKYAGEEADTIYLNLNEITQIFNLELKGAKERARDVFVFGCWVGLRVGDLNRINDYERRGDVFEILTSKTGEKVVIPVHWMADRIYRKYNGNLPVFSTAEGLAYHLPRICKAAGISERRLVAMTKGGVRKAEYYYKYDLVSPHSCRRCYATNMYLAGFPPRSIMKVTGHRTEKSFFKYIRIDKEENAQMMLNHPFLKEPSESASDPSVE